MTEEVQKQLASCANEFGLELFRELRLSDPDQNTFISPMSIWLTLLMAHFGASGGALESTTRTLRLGEIAPQDIELAARKLLESVEAIAGQLQRERREHLAAIPDEEWRERLEKERVEPPELLIASSLWADHHFSIKDGYRQCLERSLRTQAFNKVFSDPATVVDINEWVRQHTKKKIDSILSEMPQLARLILLNAVYFKGSWTNPFDKEKTRDEPFRLPDGSSIDVPAMRQSRRFAYLETDEFQAVQLDYQLSRVSMYVFLPKRETTLQMLEGQVFREGQWGSIVSGIEGRRGYLQLPRCQIESTLELTTHLSRLGMGPVFEHGAEFRGISEEPLFFDHVIHRAKLEVDEKGTVAAAVTMMVETLSAGRPSPERTFSMVVDRPYLVAIVDHATGVLLFVGSIVDPKS